MKLSDPVLGEDWWDREGGDGSGDGDTSHGKDSDVWHTDYFELKTFEK